MQSTVGERIADFLERNRSVMIDSWMGKVIVDEHDPYAGAMRVNGSLMLDLVIECAVEVRIDEAALRFFANKVSMERVQSGANMGNFVYNVSTGRSEIFGYIRTMGLSSYELHDVIQNINLLFDRFLYYAVQHYTDVQSQRLAEQSMFIEQSHQDKLTILGRMSSSFVHEFRNPLTSVIGFVQLLRNKYPSLEYIDVMAKELDELRFRINQFLLVSKKGDTHKQKVTFQLADIIKETLDFVYPTTVSNNVDIVRHVDAEVYISGYPDEFRQVVVNIIMNSVEALTSRQDKNITITAYRDGDDAVLNISNNGPRIPFDMITTIFEPFVSSKETGTGIGLYVCRQIIMTHDGTIECESGEDITTFRIVVPLASA